MRGERGQATVEQVGIVLAVALLVGGLAGVLGARSSVAGVARSLTAAIAGAIGLKVASGAPSLRALPEATAREVAQFLRANDAQVDVDHRPTLRDVQLELDERLGPEQGEAVFHQLVLDQARSVLPQAAALREYRGFWGRPPDSGSFLPPARARPIDSERPAGQLSVHVVGAQESLTWIDTMLHPSLNPMGLIAGFFPAGPAAHEIISLVATSVQVTAGVTTRLGRGEGLPPGRAEGDIIACWPVERTQRDTAGEPLPYRNQGAPGRARPYLHLAYIRAGTVLHESLVERPPEPVNTAQGEPSCNL
jgi:hypothetical protein